MHEHGWIQDFTEIKIQWIHQPKMAVRDLRGITFLHTQNGSLFVILRMAVFPTYVVL